MLLDQRRLPEEEVELRCASAAEVADAIRTLAVRGAPAIGVAAAYGYALAAQRGEDMDIAYAVLACGPPGSEPALVAAVRRAGLLVAARSCAGGSAQLGVEGVAQLG